MSIAPRPQTSPSTSSPPKGSCRQRDPLAGTTSVWPISSKRRCVGITPFDPGHEARATRRGGVALEVESRPLEVGRQQVGAELLLARLDGAVVHAPVAHERLEELRAFAFEAHRRATHGRQRRLARVSTSWSDSEPPERACTTTGSQGSGATGVGGSGEVGGAHGGPFRAPKSRLLRARTEESNSTMIRSHVVVDGSNIATEGRTTPSLLQLDDAVKAFLDEHPVETLTVVVDATFPNRIDPSERPEYEEAILAGELVTPPAGAIGRGDAFILQIAEKVDATVLSNDSFQELHATHPWVFEDGRLIGGKPVPGVGWVFLLRTPVRGPVSRRATREAKGKGNDREHAGRTGTATSPRDADRGGGAPRRSPRRRRRRRTRARPVPVTPARRARPAAAARRGSRRSRSTMHCRSSSSWPPTRWGAHSRARWRCSPRTAPTCEPAEPAATCR